jgi:hypothetical protein
LLAQGFAAAVAGGFFAACSLTSAEDGYRNATPIASKRLRAHRQHAKPMKRIATWAFYAIGALAIAYLALYAYAVFTGRDLQPGDPIHIFRKPDAPDYS